MLKIDTQKIQPICPHCKKPIDRLIKVNRGFFSTHRVFCCPECHSILGISAGQ